ncbi:DUF4932 domain-containing protein [Siphonobacter aquaeclarae]|uniref:DUF4932 domain-containing protein n=1 Tax=Siphonobacter aquaeclarae TaxID=563176 RepID=A0A1G9NHB6_9BACT|nr:DUF4932 domain-containing protein [Siphonobacter aquaeclarae]SDL85819.1 protein of unknown function [Siphonobacter aquaeclarae]
MRLLFTFFFLLPVWVYAQKLPAVRAKTNRLTMYLDGERGNFNGVNEIPTLFPYRFGSVAEKAVLALVSEKDSLAVILRRDSTTVFQIIREEKGDTVTCRFGLNKLVKAAVFTEAYKKANDGKTLVEVPEVYELANVVFALTRYGKTGAIEKGTPYYQDVMKHFSPFAGLPAVRQLDSVLAEAGDAYAPLKMDAYAFRFGRDRLVKSDVYDRVSWGEENQIAPYVPVLEAFARQTNFRVFYRKHTVYYEQLIADFGRNVDVAMMKKWLEKQFPRTRYSAVKVVFSPLVGWNQSANSFEDNGFSEAHAHINFPFESRTKQPGGRGRRMIIAFTELNHSYLNPEADRYSKEIAEAFGDLSKWITPGKPSAGYNNSLSCFEEYMNYGLVTLLFSDLFDAPTAELLRQQMEDNMVNFRGFQQFRAFDEELLRLYRGRKEGETVADLYGGIIGWAGKRR